MQKQASRKSTAATTDRSVDRIKKSADSVKKSADSVNKPTTATKKIKPHETTSGLIRGIVLVLCGMIFCASAAYLGLYALDKVNSENRFKEVSANVKESGLAKAYRENEDTVGWVKIDDTKIDYPVMQTISDPEYYLHRNFDREDSESGTPFMDASCKINASALHDNLAQTDTTPSVIAEVSSAKVSPADASSAEASPAKVSPTGTDDGTDRYAGGMVSWNWLIYGHNMKFGTMFHDLIKYEDREYFENHNTFRFDTVYGIGADTNSGAGTSHDTVNGIWTSTNSGADANHDTGVSTNHNTVNDTGTSTNHNSEPEVIVNKHKFQIFAVARSEIKPENSEAFKYYQYAGCYDKASFDEFVQGVKDESIYDTGITPEYGQQLVTLSTCAYHTDEGRFYIVGVQVE